MPRSAFCQAIYLRNPLSDSLPQSKPTRSCDLEGDSSLCRTQTSEGGYGLPEAAVGLGRRIQKGQHLPGIPLRQTNDPLAFNDALGLLVRSMYNELVDAGAGKFRRRFERRTYGGGNAHDRLLPCICRQDGHNTTVPFWHRRSTTGNPPIREGAASRGRMARTS